MPDDRASSFLQLIRRSQRGRLKIYLGYGPGVGKTFQMLSEGHRLRIEGVDVVVGLVETHGRAETEALVDGLAAVPRRRMEYHGIHVDEMDVDAILARRPQVVLIDELAHSNLPGTRNAKRYQDVQDILAAGVHVITTLNVQHLESLYDTVEHLIHVKVRERIPDSVLAEADQIVNVDLAAEDLQRRLQQGKIYPADRIASSLEHFFTASNLEHLRELTLRELASQLDAKRREGRDEVIAQQPDQLMVCLSSRGPNSAKLLRFASRLAGRLNRNWYAVYVQTPRESPTTIDAVTQRLLADTLTLANQLGATVFTFKGQDVADTILRFASEYRVSHIVIGRPRKLAWWQRATGRISVAEQLIVRVRGGSVIVYAAETDSVAAAPTPAPIAAARAVPLDLVTALSPQRIVIFDDPVESADVIRALVAAVAREVPSLDVASAIKALHDRESRGSTFLNEGVALPHARVPGLQSPIFALGITHQGVADAPGAMPIEAVFLILSPGNSHAADHLQHLAAFARLSQSRDLRNRWKQSATPADAHSALRSAGN